MADKFFARTIVRIEKIDHKGVLAVLPGWNWRKTLRFNSHPETVHLPKDIQKRERLVFYSYAMVNLKAEHARDLEFKWCK